MTGSGELVGTLRSHYVELAETITNAVENEFAQAKAFSVVTQIRPVLGEMAWNGIETIRKQAADRIETLEAENSELAKARDQYAGLYATRCGDLLKATIERDRLAEALRGVRADLCNEHRLNTLSIADVIWHSEIETTVDFIDATLSTLTQQDEDNGTA